jgi:hypothetical protein
MFDAHFSRREFNTDTVPPIHVLWARNVQGYIHAPLATASLPGVEKYRLAGGDLQMV